MIQNKKNESPSNSFIDLDEDSIIERKQQVMEIDDSNDVVDNFLKQLQTDAPAKKQQFIEEILSDDDHSIIPMNTCQPKPKPKFDQIEIDSQDEYNPPPNQNTQIIKQCDHKHDNPQEIFSIPANFSQLVDRQVQALQGQLLQVVKDVIERFSDRMNKFGLKCCEEIKEQFGKIKELDDWQERTVKTRIAQACKNSQVLCRSIQEILNKFDELENEFTKIRQNYYHQWRKNQLQNAGIMHIRHDRLFYYKKNQIVFQCPMCITRSSTISGLVTHLRKHHKIDVPDGFVCLICNKPYKIQSQLGPHLWAAHRTRKVEEFFDCPGCANSFTTKFQVLDHVPKCVYYCSGINYVMGLRRKAEIKSQAIDQVNIDVDGYADDQEPFHGSDESD